MSKTSNPNRAARPSRLGRRACRGAAPASRAFTLIELLVVISIIALLISILMPTFHNVRLMAQSTQTLGRIHALNSGCEYFFQDKKYYPGQDPPTMTGTVSTGPAYLYVASPPATDDPKITGAQVLTRDLFGFTLNYATCLKAPNGWTRDPNPKLYATLESADIDADGKDSDGYVNVQLDKFGSPRPILYFPSRPAKGLVNIYPPTDNRPWMAGVTTYPNYTAWRTFIANPTYGDRPGDLEVIDDINDPNNKDTVPYRNDSFLLIGAGMDGIYLTDDDNLNFNRK